MALPVAGATPLTFEKNMPLISLFFAVFILAGGIVAGFGVRNILNAHESRIWPHTDGTIVYSEVERSTGSEGGSSYSPGIKFQYSIQGQKYEGDIVAFGMKSVSAGRGFAERFVKKYPKRALSYFLRLEFPLCLSEYALRLLLGFSHNKKYSNNAIRRMATRVTSKSR